MPKTRRRRFLESLAAAPLLPAALVQAQAPSPEPGAAVGLARHLAEVVRARTGDQLAASDFEEVVRLIGESLEGAEKLKAVALTNADEPVTLFSARRPQAGPSAAPSSAPATTVKPGGRE